MSDPIITMLDALNTVGSVPQKSGSGWSCRCPAHDDKHPSLSIGIGEEGRVLLNCHAGCETKAIMTSLGLEMKDLMLRRHSTTTPTESHPHSSEGFASPDEAVAALERTHGLVTKRWVYTDAAGNPVGETLRWDTPAGKTIRPVSKHGDRWFIKAMPDPRPLLRLPELTNLPDGAWVYIVEGESCVDAARAVGLIATASAGGSKAAAKSDWSVLKNKIAVILPDLDDAGDSYVQVVADLCHQSGADEVRIVRLADHWSDLPTGGDLVDVLHLEGGDAESVHETLDELAQATPPEQKESEPLIGRSTYTPFPVEALPEPVRSYVADGAEAIGCDESFIALPMLSGLAAAVGNTRRIMLKRGWAEPAILWTAVIGESGTQKSPAFRLALKSIRDRQHRLMKEHQAAMKAWETQNEIHEIAMSNWKKAAAKSDKQNDTPPDPPEAPEQPTCPRNWIEDCTTEALAMLLQQNPRGLLTLRNELSGWFSFGQYKNGGGADDVARWLQMFDADALIVDRKTSGTIYVPCASVSIAGGIQPAILERSLGQQHRDNGLLARLLIAHPPRRAKHWTETTVTQSLDAAMTAVFDRLYSIEPDLDEDGDPQPRLLPLNAEAKRIWITFVNEHGQEQLQYVGDEAAAWSKLEGYAARLALVIHCVRAAADDRDLEDTEIIDRESVESGIRLSRWFADEALRVYQAIGEDDEDRDRRHLVELIERHNGQMTVRQWQRLRSHKRSADAQSELDSLVEADFGQWDTAPPGPKGGRPTRRFVLSG